MSIWWWTSKRTYFVFVMRELSSIFVAWFVLYLLLLSARSATARRRTTTSSTGRRHPWLVALNIVAFAFVLLHTVTWFMLTPQAMVAERARPAGAGLGRSSPRSTPAWAWSPRSSSGW